MCGHSLDESNNRDHQCGGVESIDRSFPTFSVCTAGSYPGSAIGGRAGFVAVSARPPPNRRGRHHMARKTKAEPAAEQGKAIKMPSEKTFLMFQKTFNSMRV